MSAPQPDDLQLELIKVGLTLVGKRTVARLVYMSDLPLPTLVRPALRRKVIHVVSTAARIALPEEAQENAVFLPSYEMGRQEKFKLALVASYARGLVREGDRIVGLVGRAPRGYPDTLLITRIAKTILETPFGEIGAGGGLLPSVFDAVVELAVQIGVEGWEGHAVGTMFVVGDSPRVMERSRQLALNPFQGYSEQERNLEDPTVRDALRAFATLDGAFVVREDGVVLAAGRYLQFDTRDEVSVPLGLGSRHVAAALCTRATKAVAVVVSQSTGKVRVFRGGKIVLELTPDRRRT